MDFEELNSTYIDDAVKLALDNYYAEQRQSEALYNKSYENEIYQSINELFDKKIGVVVLEKGELIGYLAFGNMWGSKANGVKSVSSPIHGYGIKPGTDRKKITSLLFQYASQSMCKARVGNYNITVYAHDIDVLSSYVLNQFGILCADAIRNINSPINKSFNEQYVYEELSSKEKIYQAEYLLCLYHELIEHLRRSPTFYPGEEFTDKIFLDYIQDEGTRIFVAKDCYGIIGMMDASNDGNNFVTRETDTMNVGDLFLKEAYRGKNVAQDLLLYVSNILKKDGVNRLWVEHGTTNPTAQRFWDKYFSNFTYTLTRNIDERILSI